MPLSRPIFVIDWSFLSENKAFISSQTSDWPFNITFDGNENTGHMESERFIDHKQADNG